MKYNKKPITGYIMALLFAGMAISCSKDQVLEPTPNTTDAADLQIKAVDEINYHGEIVPLELAKLVAQKTEFQQLYGGIDSTKGAKGARVATTAKVIRDAVSLRDGHNQPALHVINYQNGGFVILSAERSALPVLAFSNDEDFQTNDLPNGVRQWVNESKASLETLRTSSPSARKAAGEPGMQWDNVLAMTGLSNKLSNRQARQAGGPGEPIDPNPDPSDQPNPHPCNNSWVVAERGPYTKTKWDQSGGNDTFPYNFMAHNGALAGCGPVAVGQLIAFYKYPASYTVPANAANDAGNLRTIIWPHILNNYSTLTTAQLLRHIGDASHAIWGSGPGQETGVYKENVAKALKNTFGYKSVNLVGYSPGNVYGHPIADLNQGRPVLMRGEGHDGNHIWVCDGYRKIQSNCANPINYYLRMNWGWGGKYNGYYTDWATSPVPDMDVYLKDRYVITAQP